jgi:hypothetical protein
MISSSFSSTIWMNGACERMNRTFFTEFHQGAFRLKISSSAKERNTPCVFRNKKTIAEPVKTSFITKKRSPSFNDPDTFTIHIMEL